MAETALEFRQSLPNNSVVTEAYVQPFLRLIAAEASKIGSLSTDQLKDFPVLNFSRLDFPFPIELSPQTLGLAKNACRLPPLHFDDCQIRQGLRLLDITFASDFLCCRSHLFAQMSVSDCAFEGKALLFGSRFDREVDFERTIFKQGADFMRSEFHAWTRFPGVRFGPHSMFEGARFDFGADFTGAQFRGVSFNNAVFERHVSFAAAQFEEWAPTFHEAAVHADITFESAVFAAFKHEQDWRAYRTLKRIMATFRAQEEEGFFFAFEQRARRKFVSHVRPSLWQQLSEIDYRSVLKVWWLQMKRGHENVAVSPSITNNFISLLYDLLSDYGQSIARPFAWWWCQLLGFSYIYLWCVESIDGKAQWLKAGVYSDVLRAVFLSLASSFNPLAVFNREAVVSATSPILSFVTMVQSISSLALLTLFLLAIRRRFHKGSE